MTAFVYLFLCFSLADATSRQHFLRSCPRSLNYLQTQTGSELFDFDRYHVIGYHTVQNAIPLLFGHDCRNAERTRFHSRFYNGAAFERSGNLTTSYPLFAFYKHHGYLVSTTAQHCTPPKPADPFAFLHYPLASQCGPLLRSLYGSDPDAGVQLVDFRQPDPFSCHWWGRMEHRSPQFPQTPAESSAQCNFIETTMDYFADLLRQLPRIDPVNNQTYSYFHYFYVMLAHCSVRPFIIRKLDAPLLSLLKQTDLENTVFVIMGDHGL